MGLVIPSTGTNAKLLVGDSIETQNGFLIAPAINYIKNALFTSNTTTGWATYADAAGTTPVDGTGGSPNVTFTAVSGATVRGTYAGRLTKDASNRQGQGASYNFTIDAADTGRPVSIAFDFLASSAYVANDVGVYIYDVTNSTLITPAAINVAAGKGTFRAFFVATTSTSYRLILHVASTNASAWTLDTDNFQVGPQVQLSGAAVTDPISYTPTFNGFGTVSTSSIWRAQSGQFLVGYGNFTAGTVAASEASLLLPTGLTIDTSKLPANERIVGRWTRNNATGSAVKSGPLIVDTVNNDRVKFSYDDYTSAVNPFVARLGNGIAATGDNIAVSFQVPIANWSSNVTSLAAADPDFASNSSTTDADDTTSFANGSSGSLVPTIALNTTGIRTKRVRFQTPIQPTDLLQVEVQIAGTDTWLSGRANVAVAGSALYGIYVNGISGNNTDVNVNFGRAGLTPSGAATYGATGESYTTISRWRVRKQSGLTQGILPVSARAVVGDVTGTAVPAGYIGEQQRQYNSSLSALTNSTALGIASITLTPGVWDVSAVLVFAQVSALTGTRVSLYVSTVNNSTGSLISPDAAMSLPLMPSSVSDLSLSLPQVRLLVTTSTPVYLNAFTLFSGGAISALGRISAVRVG